MYEVSYNQQGQFGPQWFAGNTRVPRNQLEAWVLEQLANGPLLITGVWEIE